MSINLYGHIICTGVIAFLFQSCFNSVGSLCSAGVRSNVSSGNSAKNVNTVVNSLSSVSSRINVNSVNSVKNINSVTCKQCKQC